jgi:hypothetical protein
VSRDGPSRVGRDAGLPPGYTWTRSPGGSWVVRPECAEAVERGDADRLLAGRGRRDKRPGTGRGGLVVFTLAGESAVGKRALHGGVAGRLLGGIYLGPGRVLAQVEAAHRLDRAGVPTPEVLAVGWRRALFVFTVQAIVTRAIPGAENLYEAAQQGSPWRRRRAILARSAELVRSMHEAGFLHADLNVTNLVLGSGPGGDQVHVVDLEKGTFVRSISPSDRVSNLARLLRSYEKWIRGRARLGPRDEIFFLERYCRSDRALLRDLLGRLRRHRSGRLRVRVGPKPQAAPAGSGAGLSQQ